MRIVLFLFALICGAIWGADADSVSIEQKKNGAVKVTAVFSADALLVDFNKAKTEIENQRTESLKDKVGVNAEGKEITVKLTDEQKAFVNSSFDGRIVDLKRSFQLRLLDTAIKNLQVAQQRAAISDEDAQAETAAAKAKIDAEATKRNSLKPIVDIDAVK